MPTSIPLALQTNMTPRTSTINSDRFHTTIGFGALVLWALVMLSIGAAAQFGAQSSELITIELLALY